MCGILVSYSKSQLIDIDNFRKSLELQKHRGPDNTGVISVSDKLIIGNVRLSITDLSKNSNQPMVSDITSNIISFNGDKVKSNGELMISNFLFRNGIEYDYEKKYEEKMFQIDQSYNPDFKLKDKDIYIEYYGIDRKGNTLPYINKVEYKKSIKFKIKGFFRNKSLFTTSTFNTF